MQKHYRLFLLTAVFTHAAFSQAVSFGVTGGAPLLDRAAPNDESRPYLVGPSLEVRLPAGFAIEVDALYQRVGSSSASFNISAFQGFTGANSITSFERWRGNVWELPVLGKYYFHKRAAWQPFVSAGLAPRWLSRQEDFSQFSNTNGTVQPLVAHYSGWQLTAGAVAAAGIRFRTGRLAWTPEFRYTRLGGSGPLRQPNESGILLGIRF